jgi:hypothetical protein
VWQRDGQRCTYVDSFGTRCRETGGLEFDHIQPHARGGPSSLENLRLRCRAHNALTAENDFGCELVRSRRDGRGLVRVASVSAGSTPLATDDCRSGSLASPLTPPPASATARPTSRRPLASRPP